MHNNNEMRNAMKIPVVSLFSGAGGLDNGFFMNGSYDIVLALDKDRSAAETYSKNHSFKTPQISDADGYARHTFLVEDIKNINMGGVGFSNPEVVIGGPPCQDFSIIRGPPSERRGIKVERGRLYAYFVKALIRLNPYTFVFENVPGLAYQNGGASYKVIKDDFSNLTSKVEKIEEIAGNGFSGSPIGYELLFSGSVDSSAFGVPQKRHRLIILGVRRDLIEELKVDLNHLKASVKNSLIPRNSLLFKFPISAMEAFEGRSLPELEERYKDIIEEWKSNLSKASIRRWTSNGQNFTGDIMSDYLRSNNVNSYTKVELEESWEEHKRILMELKYYGSPLNENSYFEDGSNVLPDEADIVKRRMKRIPPGENYSFVDNTSLQVKGNDISVVYRRLHPLKPSYTVLAGGGGGTHGYHYLFERSGLTNRERARLQSFSDSFKFNGTKTEIRHQIGEAVPPLVGKAISEVIGYLHEILIYG